MKKILYVGALSSLLLITCGKEDATPKEEKAPASAQTETNDKTIVTGSKYPFPNAAPT